MVTRKRLFRLVTQTGLIQPFRLLVSSLLLDRGELERRTFVWVRGESFATKGAYVLYVTAGREDFNEATGQKDKH